MVAITDSDGWVPVTRPEITDIALGGNETNFPGKFFRELASRDQYLYEQALGGDAQSIASAVAFRQLGIAAVAQGRLTLETGVAVSTTDQTAKTVLYYTPYSGNYVALYNTGLSRWDLYQFTERSLSLSGLAANTNYDIFIYDASGTLTLQAVAWSNSGAGTSTRASAISQLEGIWVKDSDKRRLLGTIRTTATAGQCEDSAVRRFVCNASNALPRKTEKSYTGALEWSSDTDGVWRPINNDVNGSSVYIVTTILSPINVACFQSMRTSTATGLYGCVGKNLVYTEPRFESPAIPQNQTLGPITYYEIILPGYNYFTPLEMSVGGTAFHEGTNDQFVGIIGQIYL